MLPRSPHKAPRFQAFTLVECLAVLVLLLLSVLIAVPSVLDLLDANRLTSAGDNIRGKLAEARGLAVTLSTDIEVRIYPSSLDEPADGGSGQGIRIFRLKESEPDEDEEDEALPLATFVPEGTEETFANSVRISSENDFTSLWKLPQKDEMSDEGARPYVAFRFRPDGSTDLPELDNWMLTLVKNPESDPATLSSNYLVIQIDSSTGNATTYRPD